MRRYFGTDGIRRIANTELTPELVYKVAKAGAYVLSKNSGHAPTILIGRDTRISGTLIESAMTAGFLSYGANVKLLGVIPTPGVAYLTKKLKADASVVISASHTHTAMPPFSRTQSMSLLISLYDCCVKKRGLQS